MAETHRPMRTEVVPEIVVDDCDAALAFYAEAFGAEEVFRHALDDGDYRVAPVEIAGLFIFSPIETE